MCNRIFLSLLFLSFLLASSLGNITEQDHEQEAIQMNIIQEEEEAVRIQQQTILDLEKILHEDLNNQIEISEEEEVIVPEAEEETSAQNSEDENDSIPESSNMQQQDQIWQEDLYLDLESLQESESQIENDLSSNDNVQPAEIKSDRSESKQLIDQAQEQVQEQEQGDEKLQQQNDNYLSIEQLSYQLHKLQGEIEEKKARVQLLTNLREIISKENISLQELERSHLQNIQRKKDQKQEIVPPIQQQIIPDEKQAQFMARMISKFFASSKQEALYNEIRFIPCFQYPTTSGIKANHMLLIPSHESIELIDVSGRASIHPYFPGHQIQHIAVSQAVDESFVTTYGDDQTIRVMRIDNEVLKDSEDSTQQLYKTSTLNSIEVKSLDLEVEVTAFEYINLRGQQKYFVLGDNQGQLHVYNKNGTFIWKESTSTSSSIIQLIRSPPNIIFLTSSGQLGLINLITSLSSPAFYYCDVEQDTEIIEIKNDPYSNNQLFALTSNNVMIVFDIKSSEQLCTSKFKVDLLSEEEQQELGESDNNKQDSFFSSFSIIKQTVILLHRNSTQITLLNTTNLSSPSVDKFRLNLNSPLSNQSPLSYITLITQRLYSANYLALISQSPLPGIQLYEISPLIQNEFDLLSSIRFPLIVTVAAGIIAFQVWKGYKQKSKYKMNKRKSEDLFPPAGKATRQQPQSNDAKLKEKMKEEEEFEQITKNYKGILKNTKKQYDNKVEKDIIEEEEEGEESYQARLQRDMEIAD